MQPRFLLLVIALLAPASAAADIYRWVDEDGNVIFSDTPREGAEKVEIGEITVIPALRPVRSSSDASANGREKAVRYESIAIAQPPNEGTVRNVQSVEVAVSVSPALRTDLGHQVQLYVNGAAFGEPSSGTSFVVPVLERGTYELEAAVVDASGEELIRSKTSIFYLHKTSVLHPRPRGAP